VGECGLSFSELSTREPNIEQKRIKMTDVQEKKGGFTHRACALVLVFLSELPLFSKIAKVLL